MPRRFTDLINPSPAGTFVFIDEREDSINDAVMVVGMFGYPDQPGAWKIVDYPASYHNRAGGFSFADGHSEIKRWLVSTTRPVHITVWPIPTGFDRRDFLWVSERSTYRQ